MTKGKSLDRLRQGQKQEGTKSNILMKHRNWINCTQSAFENNKHKYT